MADHAEGEGSVDSDDGSRAPPGLSDNLLSHMGPDFRIGSLQTEKEGRAISCQVIGIAGLDGGFLVGVPHAAWHRTQARRYLPVDGLTRPVLAEVLASSEGDCRQAHPAWRVKVWIAMLRADLVPAVVFGRSAEAMTFGTAEEDAEVVFVIAGSGGGPGDLQRPRPTGPLCLLWPTIISPSCPPRKPSRRRRATPRGWMPWRRPLGSFSLGWRPCWPDSPLPQQETDRRPMPVYPFKEAWGANRSRVFSLSRDWILRWSSPLGRQECQRLSCSG